MKGFPDSSVGKESACNVGDLGLVPGLGRSLGEGKGYPVQYSGLENCMDCIVHGLAKTRAQLSDFHFHMSTAGFLFIGSHSFPSHSSEALLFVESQGCSESHRQFKKERKGKSCHAWNRTFQAV